MDTDMSSDTWGSGIVPRLFPSLGPALLICVGYIDLGKWAAAVDGGFHFGSDLVSLVLAFNCTAILCHYLAACIGVVTGKNLAQICSEEYSRPICILLGVQAKLSMIALEFTTILGIAHGLNLLFGLELLTCVFLTAIDVFLFPFLIILLDKCKAEMFFMSIAGFGLFSYVLGVLISQPESPFHMNIVFPVLRGGSAYTIMSLLGANIMPHKIYLHSYIVQQQQRVPDVSLGALCHGHFFTILLTFSGIFLVNNAVMHSAATMFHNAGLTVLTFQDSLLLMDQIFWNPIAPFAFYLILFVSSQVNAISWSVGGQVIWHDLLGIDAPVWIRHVTVRAVATVLALYCAWNWGPEGIYQLLIFCQVISAMLLPSSVIPLFRVASSSLLMGAYKISGFLEILTLFVFLGMLGSNMIFIVEMLFGDGDWTANFSWNMGSSMTVSYVTVLLIGSLSLGLALWLAATPLKSASESADTQIWSQDLQGPSLEPAEDRERNELNNLAHDEGEGPVSEEAMLDRSVLSCSDNSVVDSDVGLPQTIIDSDHEPHQLAREDNYTTVCTFPTSQLDESISADRLHQAVTVNKVSAGGLSASAVQEVESKESFEKARDVVEAVEVIKDDEDPDVWEHEEPPAGTSESIPTSTFDGPPSFRSVSGKNDDGDNGSGSLSRLSGLGRAARRQLASVLDEFWGQLYDFHGLVTKEARAKKMDLILGIDLKPVAPSMKVDTAGTEYNTKNFQEADRGPIFSTNTNYGSPKHQRMVASIDLPYGVQMGSSSWSSCMQSLDAYMQSSSSNLLDASERRYSSLQLPTYSEDRDYQPATIHGYQIASYLSRIGADRNLGSSNTPLDTATPKPMSFVPNYKDPLTYSLAQNRLASAHTSSVLNPSVPPISMLQSERNYYDSSLMGMNGNAGPSSYPKKYHSLPDISGISVSNRNSLADRNTQWSNPSGPGLPVSRTPYEQSLYLKTASRAEGVPLAFDELSPSKLYRDAFSLPPSSSVDTKSLWSKQPFEQLLGIAGQPRSGAVEVLKETAARSDSESKLLQSLRYCIMKLLKLEGADWLFRQEGGFDEELIDLVAAREKFLCEGDTREVHQFHMGESPYMFTDRRFGLVAKNEEASLSKYLVSSVPNCGEGCIWQAGLIVSFGIWCIRRILELSLMESRPELWGKYTYVLNRLQGILDLAFFKSRTPLSPCLCLQVPLGKRSGSLVSNGTSVTAGKSGRVQATNASMLLELIKEVEAAVSCRKGRTGTAAGDVAYPKGKENLASVLKRYKRRLGGAGSRKVPMPISSFAG